MIPRLAPLLVVLLWAARDASATKGQHDRSGHGASVNDGQQKHSANDGSHEDKGANAHADDMETYLHAIDSKQSMTVLIPNESIRSTRKLQLTTDDERRHGKHDSDDVSRADVTTEVYQTHIPFGTRLRPLTTIRPYTARFGTDGPLRPHSGTQSSAGEAPDHAVSRPARPKPTKAPLRLVAPPPVPRYDEPRTTPLAERRLDIDDPIFPDSPKKQPISSRKRRPKQHQRHPADPYKGQQQQPAERNRQDHGSPTPDVTPTLFRDAPYEPLPPPPPSPSASPQKRQRKTDFDEGINADFQVGIAPRQPHLPDQPNKYEPVPVARIARPTSAPPARGRSPAVRKAKKKEVNFDEILDFIDKPENLKSPKTSARKRGNTGKLFSPKENSKNAFKPIKSDISNTNKTQPHVNKRIAFLHDHPFQGSPQASFFFTNVGPNHIEYRGVFDPSSVPINFKDSPDALFQLIPQLPKLFDFDTRGIPPPQAPPKARQQLPPRLPLPTPVIDDHVSVDPLPLAPVAPVRPAPRIPLRPPPSGVPLQIPQAGLTPIDPPRQVYPLALPPPPNLQLPERLNEPFPKYDYIRGSFGGYPKIFRFNDERISILDFDKQKKAGQVLRRKGDDLDPERVPRNSFLIFHGGHFPSKDSAFGKSRFSSAPKRNRFSSFVDSGNFLEEPEPPREQLFFSPKSHIAPHPAPIGLPPQSPIFKTDGPQTSFKTTKPGGYIYFIRTG